MNGKHVLIIAPEERGEQFKSVSRNTQPTSRIGINGNCFHNSFKGKNTVKLGDK